jgi:hypothetical protein
MEDSKIHSAISRQHLHPARLRSPVVSTRRRTTFNPVWHFNVILTITDAFACYSQPLKGNKMNPPKRELFKGLVAPLVREEFDLGIRNDLPGKDNKHKCGWKGLRPAEVNQAVLAKCSGAPVCPFLDKCWFLAIVLFETFAADMRLTVA